MLLLAIETSCDETSVAVLRDGRVLAAVVASQTSLHAPHGGVVPELATREHLRNLPLLVRQTSNEAGIALEQLDAVAVTQGPGLPPALLVGLRTAQGIAMAAGCPAYGINHVEAHLYSPWIHPETRTMDWPGFQPNLSLIVSGGHTLLAHVAAAGQHRVLGSTLDDAAGECFDKTAKLLGLGYPGGPEIDRLAAGGNPAAFDFPRPLLNRADDDFSFSGLKTSVRYFLAKQSGAVTASRLSDLCASVQAAIVEVLVTKTIRAARRLGVSVVTASGGVSCNSALRTSLHSACAENGLVLRLAAPAYCTDNAAMIGLLADWKIRNGLAPLTATDDVRPRWPLDERAG
ncbi:MAG: tRNA (adenosine(37)-N6)-threonylcarbamoyltransferase complex transferase subunit TsaD [Pedosphaera sp.]|nr:tRNA (adenosine(37)-N6)-threonylcarbamoyltransferase complex transferase subunit TsaD [Pedosphaera sp.]MSU42707.1 tRNA (adenosine(37)-N6)-threonylcarbamoyltransferase complex transferase subunit TsaD [Pedosphaera sp.]